jgi:hypothetical protein
MLHEEDLAGLQLALADRQRADHVVRDHPAGVAQHVHLAELEPEQREHVDPGVHAGQHDRVQRGRHREALGVRLGQMTAAGLVPPDQLLDRHPSILSAGTTIGADRRVEHNDDPPQSCLVCRFAAKITVTPARPPPSRRSRRC